MHLEIPHAPIHSVKEFAKHYLMIVLGILTALGLEQWIEGRSVARAAEHARREMEAELRANLADVRVARLHNEESLGPVLALSASLVEQFKARRSRTEIARHIAARFQDARSIGLFFPSLRHEAWDVAVANRSASHLAPDVLGRLSVAYVEQRDAATALQANLGMMSGPRLFDALTDLEIGASDPVEFLHVLRQWTLTSQALQGRLSTLERELAKALPTEAPEGNGAASASGGPAAAR